MYTHQEQGVGAWALPTGKVVCVGRNYAEHARELNNAVPSEPMLFIKPSTAVVPLAGVLRLPSGRGACHHELELSLLIGARLEGASADEVEGAIAGYGLGLDLTLRDLQGRLKAQGHPWEIAKGFDGSCPLSPFVRGVRDWGSVRFSMWVNDALRQRGDTAEMIFGVRELVSFMSQHFTLLPGDVVLTGTPAGVGPLVGGDRLVCELEGVARWEAAIA